MSAGTMTLLVVLAAFVVLAGALLWALLPMLIQVSQALPR